MAISTPAVVLRGEITYPRQGLHRHLDTLNAKILHSTPSGPFSVHATNSAMSYNFIALLTLFQYQWLRLSMLTLHVSVTAPCYDSTSLVDEA